MKDKNIPNRAFTCLLIGLLPDEHVEKLSSFLKKEGFNVFILDLEPKNRKNFYIRWSNIDGIDPRFTADDGVSFSFSEIDCVFWRVKTFHLSPPFDKDLTPDDHFRFREWCRFVESLPALLPNAVWLNNPSAEKIADNKILQLTIAKEMGLHVPKTIISNNNDDLLSLFYDSRVVYKTLSQPMHDANNIILTTEISKDAIKNGKFYLESCPNQLQNYVDKKYELRILIILSEIISIKVNSQNSETAKIDWRTEQLNKEIFEISEIPESLKINLLSLCERLNLNLAVVDVIIDKCGNPVFLEINPGGQWAWLDRYFNNSLTTLVARSIRNFLTYRYQGIAL
ncbi:hypothetical protein AAC691_04670 [Nguyenibacter vanlangensis]|uniref:ATP-grasp domain-containing protein n=1 Tax=Nguyenibacter vanlangensis TaxID=1216886 RepID=A0ABZ3D7T3_9PROT